MYHFASAIVKNKKYPHRVMNMTDKYKFRYGASFFYKKGPKGKDILDYAVITLPFSIN